MNQPTEEEKASVRQRMVHRKKTKDHNKRTGHDDPRDTGNWPSNSLWKPLPHTREKVVGIAAHFGEGPCDDEGCCAAQEQSE